ncbi:calcium-binding protein [Acuticoccus sp. I52.16.1]|uniref:calcium-binding protein n=1 Tax=Acuticoccus sp. I52.16.1 TaxID=2928472 RepID=UPI001FD3C22A|nr:M10 family metallopeptidase C-terminal domain-containing protein [Acuticoccus sp. I52.16.1]UOM33915.1 M10 family metallopeptidase C-terminal domain-containing protein [Acuticoccus sp. I52.16.1]
MITVDATSLESGINYDTFLEEYYEGMPVGASTYRGGEPDFAFGGFYYVSGPEVSFEFEGFDQLVLLEGEEIAYDFIHYGPEFGHGISGEVDEIVFGYAGPDTTTADGTENGVIVGLESGLYVTGLDLVAAPGSGNSADNPVYSIYDAARTGDNGAEGEDPIGDLYDILAGQAQHFLGTNYDDVYTGTGYGDLVQGFNGADVLYGAAGEDRIYGDRADDMLYGGNANDLLSGDAGNDSLYGENGADSLYGQGGNDYVEGGNGHDLIGGFAGHDELWGNAGNDSIYGGGGNDTVSGGAGNDLIFGRRGADLLLGNDGNDRIYGDEGNDDITGGAGRDGLFGGSGGDTFIYLEATDSTTDAADNLRDFDIGSDAIDLSIFDLTFVDAFTGEAGEVTINERDDRSNVQADLDGDGVADMYIVVHTTGLTESDLILA